MIIGLAMAIRREESKMKRYTSLKINTNKEISKMPKAWENLRKRNGVTIPSHPNNENVPLNTMNHEPTIKKA